ncbi:LOW QUALITY PROTEIN: uncharacterized protein LOC119101827 [Pollicipes pollicipes]|uniref:LOW QUALITY PROTEIN: uncharacterized protein LOC119101827 n=1 Tax=Pollicipes pollicipes TaxID=41117 RepID=UPI001885660A|nr:LOW QUALITY PROTEIN: uncharacterized protein LOC119101827 [Pollicipes pollicipes]
MRREGQLGGERPDGASPSSRGPMVLTGPIAGDRPVVFRVSGRTELNGPDLLIQVCLDRGWILFDEDSHHVDNWNIWWRNSHFSVSQHRLLQPWQFVNHIPRANSICRKDCLARHLQRMNKVYGNIYNYSPQTYNLPLDYTKLVAEYTRILEDGDKATWICKPVGASQGKGITIFSELSTLQYDSNAVVQRYIHNPMLIAGYKFDLRIYACIPSYHPLTIYLYEEGLARFGTEKYNMMYLDNKFSHLTNTSLNKLGPAYFVEKERIGAGCKWTLSQLRHYFHQAGVEDWLLWQRVNTIVSLTVLSHIQDVPVTRNCYELYGFDILIDSDLRPWLMEVNLSPSLTADSDVDIYVKKPLLNDLFDLIGLPTSLNDPTISPQWPVPDEKLFTRPKTVQDIRDQNAARRRRKEQADTDDRSQTSRQTNSSAHQKRSKNKSPVEAPDDAISSSDTESWMGAGRHPSDDCLKIIYSSDRQMSSCSVTLDCWRQADGEATHRSDTTCAGSEPGLVENPCSSGGDSQHSLDANRSWTDVRSRRCASRESSDVLLRATASRLQPAKHDSKGGRCGSSRAASVDNLIRHTPSNKWSEHADKLEGGCVAARKRKSKEKFGKENEKNCSQQRASKSPSEDLCQLRGKRTSSGTTLNSDRKYSAASSATDIANSTTSAEIDRRVLPPSQNLPLVKPDPRIPTKVKTFLDKLRAEKESCQARALESSRQGSERQQRRTRRHKRNPFWGGDESSGQSMASAVTVLVNELGIITTLRPVSNSLPAYLTCQTHYLVPKGPQPAPASPWVKLSQSKPSMDQLCKTGCEEREMLMLAYNWHAFHNKWGNGRDWRFAPPKVGGWYRTFPFNGDTRHACEDPIDSKAIVNEVSAYLRFARKIAMQVSRYEPDVLTRQFKAKYCRHSELWMPCM